MKKILLILTLLFSFTSIYAKSNLNSEIDLSLFYHPAFDLSDDAELPMRSSVGTRWIITPVAYTINKVNLSFDSGLIFVSDSLTYNNSKMRGYAGFDLGLGFSYQFNDIFGTKLSFGAGKLQLGEEDLIEAYLIGSLTPSFSILNNSDVKIILSSPFNFIYRKQLITMTFGIGFRINLSWKEQIAES